MDKLVDFSNCKIISSRTYAGEDGAKLGIEYEGNIYMLRFPLRSEAHKNMFSNSVISEHLER